ncbi:MAG: nucleotide exchange factor GrpE [Xanthomonadaceae bacterium]|nr:nucleotide exchange factor GrpE [Xanthomonadaceae bacterium]
MNDSENAANSVEHQETDSLNKNPEAAQQAALEAAQAQAGEYREQFLRTAAELENTRKRAGRDVEQAHRYALERIAADLGPVRDSLEMGLAAAGEAAKVEALRDGVEITLKQLDQVLARHGIEVIDPAGAVFDPERHEAVQTVPTGEVEAGTVVVVIQKGLVLNGRLVRPARVLVARAPDEA